MSCVRPIRFELRRNTCAIWTSTNPILLTGEPGVVLDTGQLKIGNGTDNWNSLPFVGCGTTGPCGTCNPSGGGGEVFDYALVRNIGMHAYINNVTLSYTYNIVTKILIYTVTIYGNAIYCDLEFSYSPSLSVSGYTYTNVDTLNYNNSPTAGQPRHIMTIPYTVLDPVPGNYVVTLQTNTQNTGGIGHGSYFTTTLPIVIPDSDDMGYPDIVVYPTLSVVLRNQVTVSGVNYYGPSSFITVPHSSIKLARIYNILDNRNFNAMVFSINSRSYNYSANSAPTLEYLNTSLVRTPFPAPKGIAPSDGVNYYNGSDFTMVIVSTSAISTMLTNAVSKQTFKPRFFPSIPTGQPTQIYIGYLGGMPDETTIPLHTGGSASSSAIRVQKRYSIADVELNPDTPSITNIIPLDSNKLTKYDPAYQPYDQNFYATDFTTALNRDYVLPSTATFSTGTKYLVIKLSTQGVMRAFNVNFGSSATGIVQTWVYWTTSGVFPNIWYDATISYGSPGGCLVGYGINSVSINLNTTAYETYTIGDIYINIKFTGTINMSEILIQ